MTTRVRRNDGHRKADVAIMILISLTSLSACASAGHSWSPSVQSAPVTRGGMIPGSWARVEGLQPGSLVVITLKTKDRVDGTFNALEPAVLVLNDSAGRPFNILRSDIDRIEAHTTPDRVTNGAAIGAGIGAGAAAVILAIAGSKDGHVLPSAKWGAPLLLSGAGAVVGAFVDRANESRQIVYIAP